MQTTEQPGADILSNPKLQEFFMDQLRSIYWVEQRLVTTLANLEEAAHSVELKQTLNSHLHETKNHVSRLERIFDMIDVPMGTKQCPAMASIVDEGEQVIDETENNSAVRDVGIIFAGQKAEHYEIAVYGGLLQLARTLGYEDAAELLGVTLAEEKKADKTLTRIAEDSVNVQAMEEVMED